MNCTDIAPVAYFPNWSASRFSGNGMVGGEGAEADRKQATADQLALAAAELENEFHDAFIAGPYCNVNTPGFKDKRDSIVAVVADSFAGKDGEASLAELLNIVRAAMRLQDPLVRLSAQAWVAKAAKAHGAFHAADFCNGSDE